MPITVTTSSVPSASENLLDLKAVSEWALAVPTTADAKKTLTASKSALNSLALRQSSRGLQKKQEIIIFDEFKTDNGKIGKYNIDGSGVSQETHGGVLSKIGSGLTGVQPREIHDDIRSAPSNAIRTLRELLTRPNISNVYINVSNDGNKNAEFAGLLQKVASRGAKVYIAAGNNTENPLAKTLSGQKNIFIVSASNGIIGEKSTAPQVSATIETPVANLTANGRIVAKTTRDGGIDITGDGKAEYPANSLAAVPRDVGGMKLIDVDATAKVVKMTLSGDLRSGLVISPTDKSVATFKSLREAFPKIILPGLIKALTLSTRKSLDQLDKSYMGINNFNDYALSDGNKGGIIFYEMKPNGSLALIKQSPIRFLFPTSSFASIAALSDAVNNGGKR